MVVLMMKNASVSEFFNDSDPAPASYDLAFHWLQVYKGGVSPRFVLLWETWWWSPVHCEREKRALGLDMDVLGS